jgi:hypothetical protein
MNQAVSSLFAAIDNGTVTPANCVSAIEQAGGLAFILANLLADS